MIPLYDEPLILRSDKDPHLMAPVDGVSFPGLNLRVFFMNQYLT